MNNRTGTPPSTFLLLSAFVLLLVSAPASAEDDPLSFKGEVWNKAALDAVEDNKYEDDFYNHLELMVEGGYALTETIEFVAGAKGHHFGYYNDDNWSDRFRLRTHNAYADYAGENLNVRLGNQIVTWGKTDEISPLDLVNPEDLRDGFVRRRTGRKLPIPMLNVELFQDVYKLQGLYIPFFFGPEFRHDDINWAYFTNVKNRFPGFEVDRENPANSFDNGEFGGRFSGTVGAFDYALSYLYGRSRIPYPGELQLPPGAPEAEGSPSLIDLAEFAWSTDQPVPLEYPRQHFVGSEFETVWEEFGFRGDFVLATSQQFLSRSNLQTIDKEIIQYALGADYSSPEDFYVNVQFSQRIILDYDPNILFFEEATAGLSGEVSQELFDNNLKLEFYYYVEFVETSHYMNPNILITYWDTVHFEIGADIIGGDRNTMVGLYRDNDQIYAIVKVFI